MWETFSDNLQIVYGAVVGFAVVVALTPAVGGMARLLGVVDQPGGRRINRSPVPRLGGLALFLRFLVPAPAVLDPKRHARGPPLRAAPPAPVGAVDGLPRPRRGGKVRRPGPA